MAEEPGPIDSKNRAYSTRLYELLREKWPEYVIEIIVIIFSISISFALDEWKDGRQKQELEQLYLKGIYADIQTDTSQLKEIIAETQQVIRKADHLAQVDPSSTTLTYPQFTGDLRFIFKRPRFVAEDATFADLQSTGNMQVIESFPLKNSLFTYYRKQESTVQVEAAELDATNTIIGPYVFRRFLLASTINSPPEPNWTRVMREAEFQNTMTLRRSTRQELLRNYQESLQMGREILALIKPQLN